MFDVNEIGCWADGSFGHDHVRSKLAALVRSYCAETDGAHALALSLDGDAPDDYSDEDEAIELLNKLCVEGLHFHMCDGDLVLSHFDCDE